MRTYLNFKIYIFIEKFNMNLRRTSVNTKSYLIALKDMAKNNKEKGNAFDLNKIKATYKKSLKKESEAKIETTIERR